MSNLKTFSHEDFGVIRIETVNNEPVFCAKDICDALGLQDTNMSLKHLDDDEKLTQKIFGSGQNRTMWFVNESGMYNLIFRSTKPAAKAFRKWVTAEVLPTIRRTGGYQSPMRYIAQSNQELGRDFENLALKELLKIDSRRVRNRLAGLIEFYVSQIQ